MIRLSPPASDEQVFDAVIAWVELLAQENYEAAFQMLRHRRDEHWSPELMKTVITNYGSIEPCSDGTIFKVTSPKDNPQGRDFHEIEWWEDDPNRPAEYVGIVLFTLPLNGEWSDLTASLHIVEENGDLVLELDDIHVF
jgi:hypothetical protein